jgi:hypothetical protein
MFPILWSVCWATAAITGLLAIRNRRARYVGRVAVGVLMLVGGALYNALALAAGNDYSGFADPAHFRWVTDAWESVVPPNHLLLIGLLVAFEATVGLLVLSGGGRTQVGYVCTIGFHLALWLFGWFETVYCLVMLPALVLLLRAEQRATAAATAPAGRTQVAAWR